MKQYLLIDIGGTFIKYSLADEQARKISGGKVPTPLTNMDDLLAVIEGFAAPLQGQFVGCAISMPGRIDTRNGIAHTGGMLSTFMWEQPFAAQVEARLGVPVTIANDGKCAAAAEGWTGALAGVENGLVLVLGTGIGGGIILDGKLRGGLASSEAGHLVICHDGEPCNCGRRGCWERYASATGLIRLTREAMAAHPESALHALAAQGGVEGRTAFEAAQQGDETALAVCRTYVSYLADGLVSLINILRPEVVAIGGGVAAAPDHLLLDPLREIVSRESFGCHGGRCTRVLRAELGNDAGIIGAALLGRAQ